MKLLNTGDGRDNTKGSPKEESRAFAKSQDPGIFMVEDITGTLEAPFLKL